MAQASQSDAAPRSRQLRRWELWSVPRLALVVILLTEAVALSATVLLTLSERPTRQELVSFGLLVCLCVVFSEASDRSDRLGRYLGCDRAWVDATSVWAVSAAMTLPIGWAGLCAAALNVHVFIRAQRQGAQRAHRIIFSAATQILAILAAAAVIDKGPGLLRFLPNGPSYLLSVTAAIVAVLVVSLALVYTIIYLVMRPEDWRKILLSHDELVFETVTLILGALAGGLVLSYPWLTPGVLPVLALLYRGAMVTQLQVESTLDAKTGILNFNAWRDVSQRALLRTERAHQPIAVLLIDLDHFKRINDTYGHLVGDEVLIAVADCIKSGLREYDVVGRFGGEEFVLLLENADLYAAVAAATRLRENVSELVIGGNEIRVTASVGVSHSATSTATLDALLERADVALYEAKNAGRNTVRALAAFAEQPRDSVA